MWASAYLIRALKLWTPTELPTVPGRTVRGTSTGSVTAENNKHPRSQLWSLKKPACEVSLWLGSRNLDFKRVLTMHFRLNICFPSRNLKFWYVPKKDRLYAQPSIQKLFTESLMILPGWLHFTCCWRNKCVLHDSHGKGLWKFEAGLCQTSSHETFLFADCAYNPFTYINHSHKYNYVPDLLVFLANLVPNPWSFYSNSVPYKLI